MRASIRAPQSRASCETRLWGGTRQGVGLLAGLLGFLALAAVEDALAEAEVLGRDLQELVGGDVFDGAFERHLGGGNEAGGDARALGTEVREGFFAVTIAGFRLNHLNFLE